MERKLKILQNLSGENYITTSDLADKIGVSNRTIRNDITELNRDIMSHGAFIESKARKGIILRISDRPKYEDFIAKLQVGPMDTSANRVPHIIEYLLTMEEVITMDELCDVFFVSRSTLKYDMKEVRRVMEEYKITLDYRANQGLKVIASEQNLRNCLAYIQRQIIKPQSQMLHSDVETIRQIIEKNVIQYNFDISDYSISNLALHIYIAIVRMKFGKLIGSEQFADGQLSSSPNLDMLLSIVDEMEDKFDVKFPKEEIGYLLVQLSGKKIMNVKNQNGNTVVSDETYQIVTEMLLEVNKVFKIDFAYDLELITMLAMHLIPLEIRLKHGISVQNSVVDEIRQHIILAYNMASVACKTLEKKYGKKMSADEVAYIALHFSVALERKRTKQKENILVVCGSGKASSELLVYQVRENFGSYLNVAEATSRHALRNYNFDQVDYILTTVPIDVPVPVPIIETSNFFQSKEIKKVGKVISDTHTNRILHFFKEDMIFWPNSEDKEEVLKYLCDKAVEKRVVSDKFYQSVLDREAIGRTSFGNLVSIAHPLHPMGQESFVGLAILEKSVLWDDEKVQLVFLLSMKENGDPGMQDFYKIMSKLVSHKTYVTMLTKAKNFDEVVDVLRTVSLAE